MSWTMKGMAMLSGVYVIECDGKQYVGSARDIQARWGVHRHELAHRKHHSRYLQRAWTKYGAESFTFRVLEECPADLCLEREQYWIDTLKPVFNMHPLAHSPTGVKRSIETRAKLSAIALKRKPPMLGKHHSEATRTKMRGRAISDETRQKLRGRIVSDETRMKLSVAKKGKPRDRSAVEATAAALRGRKRPPEVVQRVQQALTGVKHTAERRARNSASHRGQIIPPEQRAKISASLKGRPSPMKGRTLTPEHREQALAALRRYRERSRSSTSDAQTGMLYPIGSVHD